LWRQNSLDWLTK